MPVNDADFKTLQDRVREIDSAISGLKFAAATLGLTGAVVAAALVWASRTAWEANSTADIAKEKATFAEKSVHDVTELGIERIKSATRTSAQVAEMTIVKGLSRITNAESDAEKDLQSYLASYPTSEMNWVEGDPPTKLNIKAGEGVCFLTRVTRVTGRFRGREEEVGITVQDGEYVLTGAPTDCCVVATARCLKFTQPPLSSPP